MLFAGMAMLALTMRAALAQAVTVHVPDQSLAQSLKDIARQTGESILFAPEAVRDRRAHALNGAMSAHDAVLQLIAGTNLEVVFDSGGALIVRTKTAEAGLRNEAVAPAPPPTGRAVETVIVTANKRAEDVQAVPSSVFVATSSTLERANVRDFDDLAQITPSLTITKTSQPANNSINIRGVGTYAFSIAAEASTVVVVDDVPQAFQAQAFRALTDVAQVEVLRGPQSTLFGKSASAGVINIVTKALTPEFSAGLSAMTTDDHETRASGFISGPITDTLGYRISVGADNYWGDLHNIFNNSWVNGHNDVDVSAKLAWDPTADWTIVLSTHWDNTRSSCCTYAYYQVSVASPALTFGNFGGFKAPYASIFTVPSSIVPGGVITIAPGPDNRTIAEDVDPQGNAVDLGGSLRIESRFDGYTLISITGYDRYDLHDDQDTDFTAFNWGPGGANVPSATVVGGSANGGSFAINSLTEELRVISPAADRFRYVAGFFFSNTGGNRFFVRGSNTLTQDGALPTVPPTTSAYASYGSFAHQTNYALFGQATYDLTGRLSIIGGLRLNLEEISYSFVDRVNHVTFGMPDCSTVTPSGLAISTCNTTRSITGRAALQYQIAPAIMVFATYDRGFKGAAYDLSSSLTTRALLTSGIYAGLPTADVIAAAQPVKPETVNSYQVGFKSVLFDMLTLNVTAFDEVFRNFQAQSKDDLTQISRLNSLGQVTTKGVELELSAYISPDLEISAAATYDEATIDRFLNAACFPKQTAALGCVDAVQNISGKPLPDTPKWQLDLNGEYDRPLDGPYLAVLTVSYHYQSGELHNLLQDPDSFQPAYGLVNLGIGLKSRNWKLTLFCNNLFDQNYTMSQVRDGVWNTNPYGLGASPVSDAIRWEPGRDSARYIGLRLSIQL